MRVETIRDEDVVLTDLSGVVYIRFTTNGWTKGRRIFLPSLPAEYTVVGHVEGAFPATFTMGEGRTEFTLPPSFSTVLVCDADGVRSCSPLFSPVFNPDETIS